MDLSPRSATNGKRTRSCRKGELYNVEVEHYPTYFVGKMEGWVHNGLASGGCGIQKPEDPCGHQLPLTPLHADISLIQSKLDKYSKLSNQELIDSLRAGQPGSLKARPDGTMVDGHHRIKILRDRGVDVDSLPREIIPKDPAPGFP